MPKRRIAMRKIKRIMRLSHEAGRSQREIARACGLSQPAVQRVLKRAREAGLAWPLPEGLDEQALAARLYGERPASAAARRAEPDFAAMREQLKKHKHVTLERLWQEYREGCPDGYSYSHFCALYARWRKCQDPVLRQDHKAGEKLFIDYAGADGDGACAGGRLRGAVVRGGAGREFVHLRRGESRAGPAQLAGVARTRVALLPRLPRSARARQFEVGGDAALPVRAGGEPQLRGDGGALRHVGGAGQAAQAAGQSESRGRGAGGGTPHRSGSAASPLRQPGGVERGDPRAARRAESRAVPEARGVAAEPVRGNWTGRRCRRCRRSTTSSRNGTPRRCISTTTRRCWATTTRRRGS